MSAIYLDNHATTRVDPRVLAAMLPYFTEIYGNAASRTHTYGRQAEAAIADARETVGGAIGAKYSEVIFTAGATESNALAIEGVARGAERGHLITSAIEHASVLGTCRRLAQEGWRLTVLPVDRQGLVDPDDLRRALRPETMLVSVMAANNEIGTIQDIAAIGRVVGESGALFHVDATQALGRIPMSLDGCGIDLMSLSGHKVYGPKGIGALYVRRKRARQGLRPLVTGGGHEMGLRPGTLNVPGIVGLGTAVALAVTEMAEEAVRVRRLRDKLFERLREGVGQITLNGHPERRLSGNLNVSFEGIDPTALIDGLPDVAVSAGSACSAAMARPSHVLEAIGAVDGRKRAALRFGVGRFNTETEIDQAAESVIARVWALRSNKYL